MNIKIVIAIVVLCVICATIVMAGCVEQDNTFTPIPIPILTPNLAPVLTPTSTVMDPILNNITQENITGEETGVQQDVYVCGSMACKHAEWRDKYGYNVGAVTLIVIFLVICVIILIMNDRS